MMHGHFKDLQTNINIAITFLMLIPIKIYNIISAGLIDKELSNF